MQKKPTLSIIVPTKNRYETLTVLVNAVLSWNSNDFEIVVQDNSDDTSFFQTFLNEKRQDNRLVYHYTDAQLSAVENCDLAVSVAKGDYLCFIGDDDGLVEQCIALSIWMREQKIDAFFGDPGSYTWPDMEHAIAINNRMNGKLILPSATGHFALVNPEEQLLKVIESGGQNMWVMPRLYHGIVKKTCLDKLHQFCGTCFPGPVPDMSNAVALIPFLSKCVYSDLPFIISGQSKKSMSGRNAVRDHQGDIRQEKSIPSNAFERWSVAVPRYWCAPSIWAEAVLKAAQSSGQENVLTHFNFSKLYASCLAFSKIKYYVFVWSAFNYQYSGVNKVSAFFYVLIYFIKITWLRAKTLLNKFKFSENGILASDIEEAMEIVCKKVGQPRFPDFLSTFPSKKP